MQQGVDIFMFTDAFPDPAFWSDFVVVSLEGSVEKGALCPVRLITQADNR